MASKKKYSYEFPRPALAVDCVVFSIFENGLKLLLIERGEPPFQGAWALPGGFVRDDETSEEAARRELAEETGLKDAWLEQLYTFSDLKRDPRERVVSIAWSALVKPTAVKGGTDAENAAWVDARSLPELAFDHAEIVNMALQRLQAKIRWQPIGFELLPPTFTLGQLQRLYEKVLDRKLDPRNFRRSFLKMEILEDTGKMESGVSHRPSRLYRFDQRAYENFLKQGFSFEV